jgi:hypothetical protein
MSFPASSVGSEVILAVLTSRAPYLRDRRPPSPPSSDTVSRQRRPVRRLILMRWNRDKASSLPVATKHCGVVTRRQRRLAPARCRHACLCSSACHAGRNRCLTDTSLYMSVRLPRSEPGTARWGSHPYAMQLQGDAMPCFRLRSKYRRID